MRKVPRTLQPKHTEQCGRQADRQGGGREAAGGGTHISCALVELINSADPHRHPPPTSNPGDPPTCIRGRGSWWCALWRWAPAWFLRISTRSCQRVDDDASVSERVSAARLHLAALRRFVLTSFSCVFYVHTLFCVHVLAFFFFCNTYALNAKEGGWASFFTFTFVFWTD